MKNYLDGGEAILEAFRRLGIDYIMSSPGSEWSPLWEALARQQLGNKPGPTFVESWHETLAVNMAAGYTLITGRPQAVLVHAGVGLLQGSLGIQGAQTSEIPMIVMSGEAVSLGEDPDLDIEPQWYGGLTLGGYERLMAPITKWARSVASPHTLHETVIRAGEMAQRVPMGPVYLDVPLEHMLHDWAPPEAPRAIPPAPKLQALTADVDRIAGELRNAKTPVIVVETAGRDPDAYEALVALAELLAVPVICGRSNFYANFPSDHPLYLGMGNYQHLKDADLVLLVSGRAPWYPPRKRPTAGKIVLIHENPIKEHMLYQHLHADAYLEGDVATTLQMLADAARAAKPDAKAVAKRKEKWSREHDTYVAGLRAEEKKARAASGIDPLALCSTLAEVMPKNAIYVDETITHSPMLRQHLPIHMPQSFFRGGGGLGQGIGTALGIKLAARERPVALLVGDGTFLYNPIIQALGASKRHELPVLIVVFNNKQYLAMKKGHIHHYPDGASVGGDLFFGSTIDGPRYDQLGSHFGFHGEMVEKLADLKTALQRGLQAVNGGNTAILNVVVSR
jgi:acetolactate synthase-1/2/3 large subunit